MVTGVRTDKSYILTDRCILTNKAGKFGSTDCGRDYILNFFKHHKCNSFCESHWKRPQESDMSQNVKAIRRTSYAFETKEFQSRRAINKQKESVFNANAVLAQYTTTSIFVQLFVHCFFLFFLALIFCVLLLFLTAIQQHLLLIYNRRHLNK